MNKRLKELAEQVGATIHKAMHGEAISFLENDLERFADLVRQDYLRELRALKPVAWGARSIYGELEGLSFDKQPRFDIPLYALAQPEQKLNDPPAYVEPPTSDYHNGWEEGFEAAKNLFKEKK